MTTEARVEEANLAMAAIADDIACETDRRERLRAIWQPVAHDLIDHAARVSTVIGDASNPNYVGLTCDTKRAVFLDKEISASGLVYRKFVLVRGARG